MKFLEVLKNILFIITCIISVVVFSTFVPLIYLLVIVALGIICYVIESVIKAKKDLNNEK